MGTHTLSIRDVHARMVAAAEAEGGLLGIAGEQGLPRQAAGPGGRSSLRLAAILTSGDEEWRAAAEQEWREREEDEETRFAAALAAHDPALAPAIQNLNEKSEMQKKYEAKVALSAPPSGARKRNAATARGEELDHTAKITSALRQASLGYLNSSIRVSGGPK